MDVPADNDPTTRSLEPTNRQFRLWHSRGYLPHFDGPGIAQFLTFRLHDAVPAEVVQGWATELQASRLGKRDRRYEIEMKERIARYEDQGHGSCLLQNEDVTTMVETGLMEFDAVRYRLISWCVMPNHVHVLIEPGMGFPISTIVHQWKSFTSKAANRILGRSGRFWMPDYFDRYIRDQHHLKAVVAYIEENPVTAGLVQDAKHWKRSSARRRGLEGD